LFFQTGAALCRAFLFWLYIFAVKSITAGIYHNLGLKNVKNGDIILKNLLGGF